MSFNDLEIKRIQNCAQAFIDACRPPPHIRPQLDLGYRITGQSLELFEIRPQWDNPKQIHHYPFTKATWIKAQEVWKIYWRRADLKWHGYEPEPTVASLDEFFRVLEEDRHACFFG